MGFPSEGEGYLHFTLSSSKPHLSPEIRVLPTVDQTAQRLFKVEHELLQLPQQLPQSSINVTALPKAASMSPPSDATGTRAARSQRNPGPY